MAMSLLINTCQVLACHVFGHVTFITAGANKSSALQKAFSDTGPARSGRSYSLWSSWKTGLDMHVCMW